METLQIADRTRQVPSTWNELTRRQLLDVVAELYAKERPGRKLRLLSLVTGFEAPLLASLHVVQVAQLLPLMHFIESEDHLLTEQLLPTLRLRGRQRTEPETTWYGPLGHLSNVSFGEFMFADTYFAAYALYQRPEHLDQFITALYRPRKRHVDPEAEDWNGDVRGAFNEHQLAARQPRLATVERLEKLAIVTWYRGCRAELAREFPAVFAEAEEGAKPKPPEWEPVLRKLAGPRFGTVAQTAAQPLRLILGQMQDDITDYQQQLAASKTR